MHAFLMVWCLGYSCLPFYPGFGMFSILFDQWSSSIFLQRYLQVLRQVNYILSGVKCQGSSTSNIYTFCNGCIVMSDFTPWWLKASFESLRCKLICIAPLLLFYDSFYSCHKVVLGCFHFWPLRSTKLCTPYLLCLDLLILTI